MVGSFGKATKPCDFKKCPELVLWQIHSALITLMAILNQ
jgi:hypothetical protein